jgi:retron-type reverse transcriptase
VEGKFAPSTLGTPQGGSLSPLLTNIYLNQLDKEVRRA